MPLEFRQACKMIVVPAIWSSSSSAIEWKRLVVRNNIIIIYYTSTYIFIYLSHNQLQTVCVWVHAAKIEHRFISFSIFSYADHNNIIKCNDITVLHLLSIYFFMCAISVEIVNLSENSTLRNKVVEMSIQNMYTYIRHASQPLSHIAYKIVMILSVCVNMSENEYKVECVPASTQPRDIWGNALGHQPRMVASLASQRNDEVEH